MTTGMAVGLQLGTQPPLAAVTAVARFARLIGLRSLMTIDHFQNIFPSAIWDEQFSWLAARRCTPHEHFDYQALLGYLAARTRHLQLGVGVTEAIRRHPVLLAQTMLTVAQMTKKAPILGIGAGERMNIDPYGLDFSHPVARLEEALQIIRRCFTERGPISFTGHHFTLDNALMDLRPPPGRAPAIWVAGHGPKMLELTATYGDGWYPTMVTTPQEYATKLAIIRATATRCGQDPQAITPALHRFVVVGPTEHEVEALLRHKSVRMLGLAAPAELWRNLGAQHPFGDDFRGYIDFVPQHYDRPTPDNAIDAVPPELVEQGPLLWGTPPQIIDKLRAFGDAGLRHVILAPVSGLVSAKQPSTRSGRCAPSPTRSNVAGGDGLRGSDKGGGVSPGLRRVIGPGLLLFFVVGDILGVGIYALVGSVAARIGGALWLPFLLAFVVAFLTALSYLELVGKYPRAAGAALYTQLAFGVRTAGWPGSRSRR